MRCTIVSALSALSILGAALGQTSDNAEWNWAAIEPSRELEWHKCFDCAGQCEGQLDCARLDLPMDWSNPSDDQRVVLAISRIPAVNKTDYRGPVILNPGGAGGSGIYVLRLYGKYMQSVVGDNHDFISFDPRGIGASTPRYQCFDYPSQKAAWDLQDPGVIDADAGFSLAPILFARAQAYSELCERKVQKTGLVQNSGTTYIARDMLEIVNKGDPAFPNLKYWGFSYGTIIGGVFAAMFPDRVERLLSDANVSYKEWFQGGEREFLNSTEVVMDAFYHYCHKAGPEKCEYYEDSPVAIGKKLDALFERLKTQPVVIRPDKCTGPTVPELITYSKLKHHLRESLYQPYYGWPYFATILAALEKGDGRPYYAFYNPAAPAAQSCEVFVSPLEPLPGMPPGTTDAYPFMRCADRPQNSNSTLEDFVRNAKELIDWSPAVGASNVDNVMRCIGRTATPNYRYDGDFKVKTKHPVLFVNNVADSITPILSAHTNSAGFSGSVVLQQNSYGHTFLAAPSKCTEKYILEYFQDGTLPEPGTECEGNSEPFWPVI
ncbi:hypothetical protein ACHAQA_000177 [Verticillium albo-atrum]